MHDLLQHPWLSQFENNPQSVIDKNGMASNMSFRDRIIYSSLDRQQAGDFTKLLFSKMSWIHESQNQVCRLSEVFKLINVSGNGFLTKLDFYRGLADNYGDMGFSEEEWESMFHRIETNDDGFFNYSSYIFGVSSFQRLVNEKKIRESFHLIDVNGDGLLNMAELRNILDEEYNTAGESGASVDGDGQIWVHIMDELEKDGVRQVTYTEFHDAILMVIQRVISDDNNIMIQIPNQRDANLRNSIII